MKLLLVDIIATTIENLAPAVEYSLGLMYVSSSVRRHFGDRVQTRLGTIVSRIDRPGDEESELRAILHDWQPDVVGFRALSIAKDVLHRLVAETKAWSPACPVLVGGPHATDDPGDVLENTAAECAVLGEGEDTAVELLERLLAGQDIHGVHGIALRSGSGVVRTPPRAPIDDLDALPWPDYGEIDQDRFTNRYLTFSARIFRPHGNVLTSRGCPYRCMYCHNILGKAFRARSAESVVDEIRYLHDHHGLRDFQIIDDIFNLDRRRAHRICDLLLGSGMDITLSFPNGVRTDLLDRELIEKLAATGTRMMSIAVETASPRLQKLIRKNLKLDQVLDNIGHATRAGVITRGFFMVGFPTETLEEARQTIQFAVDSELCGATFFTVVYFPGTELYELARQLGYFRDRGSEVRRDYVEVGEGPYEFSAAELVALKREGVRRFAFSRERVDRALRVLPVYFSPREIHSFFMAYVVSADCRLEDVEDPYVRNQLRRHFAVARHFSREGAFYV